MRKFLQTGWRWLWVALIVLVLDRLTKFSAQYFLLAYSPVHITSFFNLTLAYNKGAAFSFLGNASGWQSIFFALLAIVVSVILLVWLQRLTRYQWWLGVALTLIIGGALGNFCDRIYYGHVIDFLQFHAAEWYWPVFNVADSAICIGALMVIAEAVFKRNQA